MILRMNLLCLTFLLIRCYNMKGLNFLIFGIFLIFVNCLFTGFIFMGMYDLAIVPLLNCFFVAPEIPYGLFVIFTSVVAMLNSSKESKKKYSNFNEEFWIDYFSSIFQKLVILGITFIFNLLFI